LTSTPAPYERLRAEYRHATEQGYSHGFDTYAYNYCSVDHCVTVDGEPVDPDTQP
jgi:inorganic pyrophosphatase